MTALFAVAIQEKSEATVAVKAKFTETFEQIALLTALFMTGFGFTVIVTVCVEPAHNPKEEVGITV